LKGDHNRSKARGPCTAEPGSEAGRPNAPLYGP